MPQPATTSLFQAATSTFESLALLFPEPGSNDGLEFIPLAEVFSVTYHGAGAGRVVVGVTAGVLPALAENMLGAAAAPDPQLQRDALGELVNVVTGNVLPMVHGAAAVFRLNAPAPAGEAPLTARSGETQVALARLRMDEGDAVLAMFSADAADTDAAASGAMAVVA
jgi:CheY-specific phosphatase CheX